MPIRNALTSEHLVSLVFINCVGPPIQLFKPEEYVMSWIKLGKWNAEETRCSKRDEQGEMIIHLNIYGHIWFYKIIILYVDILILILK